MSDDMKMEDIVEAPTSEVAETVVEIPIETTEQDPLKNELERVRSTSRPEIEKAAFALKKNADRFKELGGDPGEVLGFKTEEVDTDDEDEKPVTLGMLKKMQKDTAVKSAIQLANDIENESERELVKFHIENTIKSTGNPTEDLRLAKMLVNSVKNAHFLEEIGRKGEAKNHSSASSAPAKDTTVTGELTHEEIPFSLPPFNMSKEQILKLRK